MIPSKGRDIGVGVIVEVEGREVSVSEVINKQVDEPFPGRGDGGCLDFWEVIFQHLLIDDLAFFVLAQSDSNAYLIRWLFVEQGLDDDWSCEMDEGFAGGLDDVVEHLAELLINEVSNCHLMVAHVVLHYSKDDHAKSALILEATLELIS